MPSSIATTAKTITTLRFTAALPACSLSELARLAVLRQAYPVPVDDRLEQTLLRLEPALGRASHQWWIISSAAVALHMKGGVVVGDVDVLLDERDVAVVFAALDIVPATGQGTELFRSRAFGTWLGAPLAVELFAGFELCEAGRWSQIVPLSRIEITLGSARTFVPDARELAQMLLRFGRDKDRRRAALLSASCPFPSR